MTHRTHGSWYHRGRARAHTFMRRCGSGALAVLITGCAADRGGVTDPQSALSAVAEVAAWVPTPAMSVPRGYHTLTLLADGRVLMAGGHKDAPVTEAEIYNPACNIWSPAPSISRTRVYATATLLQNGAVLLAGGSDIAGTAASSAEIYDPSANTWSLAASMLASRTGHTAALLRDGKVLVAGGTPGGVPNATSSAELYDPVRNTWSPAGSMHVPRYFHAFAAATLSDGRVLVAGGQNAGFERTAEIYDPTTNTWNPIPDMSVARTVHTGTVLPDGRVFVVGGYTGTEAGATSTAEIYNPSTNSWTSASAMSVRRYGHTAALLSDGKVLVAGGVDGSNFFSTTEVYDPGTNTWSPGPSMSERRFTFAASRLQNGRVLVSGGHNGTQFVSSAEVYVPDTGSASPPDLYSVSPNSGTAGESVSVTLSGANFSCPATIGFSDVGIEAHSVTVVNSTTITAVFAIGPNTTHICPWVIVSTPAGSSPVPNPREDAVKFCVIPAVLSVRIDIKPGSFPNSINLGSGGTVPVAVFSTETFDARSIDPASVTLASAPVKLTGKGTPMTAFEDLDNDGLLDLVVHVATEALQLSETDEEAVLEGQTFGGRRIRGTDTVRIVP